MKMNMTNFGEVCISLHPSFHKPTHQYIKPPLNNIFKVSIKSFLEPYLENGSNVSRRH